MKTLDTMANFFLMTETQQSPWHALACEVLEYPTGVDHEAYITELIGQLQEQTATFPFNACVDKSLIVPQWKKVDIDHSYHIQRQILPAPGGDQELMKAVEHFYLGVLDSNMPLWQCTIIEGLSDNRFAVIYKLHHALMDGQGGLKRIFNSLNTATEQAPRALWGDNRDNNTLNEKNGGKKRAKPPLMAQWMNLPRQCMDMSRQCLDLSWKLMDPKSLGILNDMRLFRAPTSPLNKPQSSSARRFGFCDLPLEQMKTVAKSQGVSINDLLLCVVDMAVQRYMHEHDMALDKPLVCGIAVSTRTENSSEGGNQAGIMSVALGDGKLDPLTRLSRINGNTKRAKTNAALLPGSLMGAYGMMVLGMPMLLKPSGLDKLLHNVNLAVSNITPPKGSDYLGKPLYQGKARLRGLYTQPILPHGVLLNITTVSYDDIMCVGIGSTKEAIDNPILLGDYMIEALDELTETVMPSPEKKKPVKAKRVRKPKALPAANASNQ